MAPTFTSRPEYDPDTAMLAEALKRRLAAGWFLPQAVPGYPGRSVAERLIRMADAPAPGPLQGQAEGDRPALGAADQTGGEAARPWRSTHEALMDARKSVALALSQQRPEPTLKPYEPSWLERIRDAIMFAGLGEGRPSPERRRFAEGVADVLGFVPAVGNVLGFQDAYQKGDRIGMHLSIMPIPASSQARGIVRAAEKEAGSAIRRSKHTLNATHEFLPGSSTGHLPELLQADPAVKRAYEFHPASTWAMDDGRDAIYAGLQIPGTGNAMRVMPTTEAQGFYMGPTGVQEANRAQVARPLVALDRDKDGLKRIAEADRALVEATETLRALLDGQNAGASHIMTFGGPLGKNLDVNIPLGRQATPEEMFALQEAGRPLGLESPIDTGTGINVTDFGRSPPADPKELARFQREQGKNIEAFGAKVSEVLPDATGVKRGAMDASLHPSFPDRDIYGFDAAWMQGSGSGAATSLMLEKLNRTPEIRALFNQHPLLAEKTLAKLERDAELGQAGFTVRNDLQNLRSIVAKGPGWLDEVERRLKDGSIALPAVGALLFGLQQIGQREPSQAL